jgi:protein-S-isoprenylcysteine O-methyltransferase Ste14
MAEEVPKTKRILPPTFFLAAIVVQLILHFAVPISNAIPFPWSLLGALPLAGGITLNLVADRNFRVLGTTVKPFGQSSALITGGVYGISRNPMYLGMICVLMGAGNDSWDHVPLVGHSSSVDRA